MQILRTSQHSRASRRRGIRIFPLNRNTTAVTGMREPMGTDGFPIPTSQVPLVDHQVATAGQKQGKFQLTEMPSKWAQ